MYSDGNPPAELPSAFPSRSRLAACLLFAILLAGFALRLYGLNWDQGYGLHPDERYITRIAATIRLPAKLTDSFRPFETGLNPYMWPPDGRSPEDRGRPFAYGHLPLYLIVLVAGGDADEARLALVGRVLSATFDTVTVLFTFALARRLYDTITGLLAAAFVAFTAMHIQLSHFATFDTALTCFVLAALLFSTRFVASGRKRDAVVAGLCCGLAVSSKSSAILLVAPLLLAHVLSWQRGIDPSRREGRDGLLRVCPDRHQAGMLGLSLLTALLVFGLTSPFAVIQASDFKKNLKNQAAVLHGADEYPFTRQYAGTWPYVYPIEQQFRWGMGLPLGLVAFGGSAYAFVEVWRFRARNNKWIPLIWMVTYFGFTGGLFVKFMRYMLPVSPVFALHGAGLIRLCAAYPNRFRWCGRLYPNRRGLMGATLAVSVVLLTFLYAFAFINVYRGDHPWLRLSRWVYEQIPADSSIAYERWDHQLPLTVDQGGATRWSGEYRQIELDPYVPDTPAKLSALLERLAASDYLVIASNRLYGSITRWPTRYPLMNRFYARLFEGRMGFRLALTPNVERHPGLGPLALRSDPIRAAGLPSPLPLDRQRSAGLTLSLGRADESFTVYDHPRPLLFENVARYSATEMRALFVDLLRR